MKEIITNKDTTNEDDVISKFNSFRDGLSDVLVYLFKKNEYYYVLLMPYDTLFLEENVCVKVCGKDELFNFFEELVCNFGLMIIEECGTLSYNKKNSRIVECIDDDYDLITLDDFFIYSNNEEKPLLRGEKLTNKLKGMIPIIFGSNRNVFLSPYIYNSMYIRTTSPFFLNNSEYTILEHYKRRGYKYINSFLRNNDLDRTSVFEVMDEQFIDDLFCLYDIFDKIPVLETDLVVFRGATEIEAIESNYNSFISTSLDITVANSFSGCLLYEIILPKGSHYIPVDAIDKFSTIFGETEAEILLRPGSFEIVSSGVRKEVNYLKVIYHEKDKFASIVVDALERRKDELIKRGFCDLKEYENTLEYARGKEKTFSEEKVLKKMR